MERQVAGEQIAQLLGLEQPKPTPPKTYFLRIKVTACSPDDPKDRAYYASHGYEGASYNIAADYRYFPKGTKIRVPGYLEQSYPGKFWEVDSKGGSVIRRSSNQGNPQIDVKFTTYYSARNWGTKWLDVEIMLP